MKTGCSDDSKVYNRIQGVSESTFNSKKKANGTGDESETNILKWIRFLSLLTLQCQLIGRKDDIVHIEFCNLTPNIEFPFLFSLN